MKRTFNGKVYGLRVIDRECCASDSRLTGSLIYAMQRHYETGKPYLCSIYGHVLHDCSDNREALKALNVPIAAVSRAL
jgi:hypothetical protein